jgi:hypothetical protein
MKTKLPAIREMLEKLKKTEVEGQSLYMLDTSKGILLP